MTPEKAPKDITEEVHSAKHLSDGQHDPWQDYIDWKRIRSEGHRSVIVDGVEHAFTKWGLAS